MRRRIGWRGLCGLVAALGLLVLVAREVTLQRQRAAVLAADWATQTLGRHFIVGYSSFEEVSRLAASGLIGGVYIGRNSARSKSVEALRAEIDAWQRTRAEAGLPPLFIAADQEGGKVAHLSPPLAPMPALSTLVEAGSDASLEARARAYGATQGQGLAGLGINLNFGPVVDLRPDDGPWFDTHTRIAQRAISRHPEIVSRVAQAYGEGLLSQGVRPTLKHFPGLGQVSVDTHHSTGRVGSSKQQLAAADWQPFRRLSRDGGAIMLGHVVVEAIDPESPASLSRPVVQQLIRREWGFDGLLVTDDLNMGGVAHLGVCKAAVAALAAGVDLVLVSYDPAQYYPAMACAAEALRKGLLDQEMLRQSRRRIERNAPAAPGATVVRTGAGSERLRSL